jgi:outer membrane protein OmpA-like peptidoglycan-associated protein
MILRSITYLGLVLAATPALACPLGALQQAQGPEQALAAHRAILDAGTACSGEQRDWAGRVAAAHHVQAAQRLLARGGTPAAAIALLDAGLRLGTLWQGLALRGDLRQKVTGPDGQPDFAAASEDYQAALNAIDAGDPRADPVAEDTIAGIWRKAEQTRLLAERVVASPITRAGEPGGLERTQLRNFRPTAVAVAVQFQFGRVEPTEFGMQALVQLDRMLEAQGRPPIVIIGHTDPVGSDAYNLDLSARRAIVIARVLVSRGYDPQRIRAEGHGKRDPLRIENAENYTEAQIFQMLRRVEVRRL